MAGGAGIIQTRRSLDEFGELRKLRAMKFVLSIATYLVMALILAAGILMAIKGSLWLLVAGVLGYLVLLTKFGCQTH